MCGLFAVFNAEQAAQVACLGCWAIQHRAQDFAGICSCHQGNLYRHAGPGWMAQVFDQQELDGLPGLHAISHIRYPTSQIRCDPLQDNAQPIIAPYGNGYVAMGHNGNLTNADVLRCELQEFAPFETSMDTECILRLFCGAKTGSIITDLEYVFKRVRGTYSLAMLFTDPECLLLVRDPSGNRPLWIGKSGESWFAASETVALEKIGADIVRAVQCGEAVIIDERGLSSHFLRGLPETPRATCFFEAVYFAHPAGFLENGITVSEFRLNLGKKLAQLFPVPNAELILGVPSSADLIGRGYALALGKSDLCMPGLVRSNYATRSFIAINQDMRDLIAKMKFSVDRYLVCGKSVVVVDDSIVRSTTIRKIIKMLFSNDAREVHVRVGCPPVTHPCRYGIAMPTYAELIAAQKSLDEIRQDTLATSIEWLPIEALHELVQDPDNHCFACITGKYPLPE